MTLIDLMLSKLRENSGLFSLEASLTIIAENSNIGIASKDSSVTKINNAYLKNVKTCVSAYNKKQEFYGGFLEIKNIDCKNYVRKIVSDTTSKIIIENEL